MSDKYSRRHLHRDIAIVFLSVMVAILLGKSGAIHELVGIAGEYTLLASFIAGLFFTSIFTTAPAIVALGELTLSVPIWEVALVGALGAMIGDLILFIFVRDSLAEDIAWLMKKVGHKKFFAVFHMKFLRWFTPIAGALVIASPLPDELGLAMMGLSKTKTSMLVPISLCMNALGIVIIGLVARSL